MAFEAAAVPAIVFGQGGDEAHRQPDFLVGLGGKESPDQLDSGQPQLSEKQLNAGSLTEVGRSQHRPAARC